jgi:hypothetical protein
LFDLLSVVEKNQGKTLKDLITDLNTSLKKIDYNIQI